MKKKVLLLIAMLMVGMSPVLADNDAATKGSGSIPKCSTGTCFTTNLTTDTGTKVSLQNAAVRISIVDEGGGRVAGTGSIDVVGKSALTTNPSELGAGSLRYSSSVYGRALQTAYGRHTRNEVLASGGVSYGDNNSPTVYYSNLLSSTTLHSYVQRIDNLDNLKPLFSLLGYDWKAHQKNGDFANHYVLIEPLMFMAIHNASGYIGTFFGTTTEVWYMTQTKAPLGNNMVFSNYASSLFTTQRVNRQTGAVYDVTAGLTKASGLSGNYATYIGTSYGVASAHIWLYDVIPECVGDDCSDKPIDKPKEEENGCNFDLKANIANECSPAGSTSTISDNTTNMKCIYDTLNSAKNTYNGEFYSPSGANTFNGTGSSNRYCTVVCTESISYDLPGSFAAFAGNRFYLGTSGDYSEASIILSPIMVRATSTCRTGYKPGTTVTGNNDPSTEAVINIDKFRTEYAAANANVLTTYDMWQNAEARLQAFNNARLVGSSQPSHNCTSTHQGSCARHEQKWDQKLNKMVDTDTCLEYNQEVDDDASCRSWEHGVSGRYATTVYTYSGYYANNGYAGSVSYTTSTESQSGGPHGENKTAVYNSLVGDRNAKKAAYQSAVAYRDYLLQQIKNCNNFQRVYNEVDPKVSYVYSDTYYDSSYLLKSNVSTSASTAFYNGGAGSGTIGWSTNGYEGIGSVYKVGDIGVYGSSSMISSYVCNANYQRCYTTNTPYPVNTSVVQTTTKQFNYQLPDNVYRYVAKNGVSYNTPTEAYASDYPYKDLGASSLPISYNTPTGTYDDYFEIYYANGHANLFGTNQKFLKYDKVSPGAMTVYNGLAMSENLKYHCTYDVSQRFMEDNNKHGQDINVIYRPISLNNPFPGENGNGRSSGSNWQGIAYILGLKMNFIDAYITNNRGVKTEEVYNLTPMYQFVLSPANIRAIRKYNNEVENDFNDFTLECKDGEYCMSSFLADGLDKGYFSFTNKFPTGGSCFGSTETEWESCRYTNIGG